MTAEGATWAGCSIDVAIGGRHVVRPVGGQHSPLQEVGPHWAGLAFGFVLQGYSQVRSQGWLVRGGVRWAGG